MPQDSPARPRPTPATAPEPVRTHPKTEPDDRVLAEYMRLVEEARMRT